MFALDNIDDKPAEKNGGRQTVLAIPGFYGDHAVFQHGKTTVFRGTAVPFAKVDVFIGSKKLSVFANRNGEFTVKIPPMPPARGLDISVVSSGERVTLHDIAFGNVYIFSGQSNMQMVMKEAVPDFSAIRDMDLSAIRCFSLPADFFYGVASFPSGDWMCADEEVLQKFTALGGFFAAGLYENTRIPVGIVNASYGGVNIEAFVSEYSLLSSAYYAEETGKFESTVSSIDTECDSMADTGEKLYAAIDKMFPEIPADGGLEKGFCDMDFDDSAWDEMLIPDSWTQAGHNHAGIFYFRKHVQLPPGSSEEPFTLHLGAVDKADKIFVNGVFAGETGVMNRMDHWNTLRVYDIPAGVFQDGDNVIAVQASSLLSVCADGGLIGPAEEMYLVNRSQSVKIPLNGKWKMCETFDAGTQGMTCMRNFGQGGSNSLHNLFDTMIRPLEGTALAGVVWYQGEANAICMSHTYQELLELMIADWRRNFLDPELNFYIVQLPDFQTPHLFAPFATWPAIREAQYAAAQTTDSVLVVTIGSGDVVNVHPVNKKAVADSISEMETVRLNGGQLCAAGLSGMEKDGGALLLCFDQELDESAGSRGMVIAGKDMVAFEAECRFIAPNILKVWNKNVSEPFAVWYAWAENPRFHDLRTASGMPVSPFRAALDGSLPQGRNLID